MLSVFMLSVIMLSVIRLNVIMQSVDRLNVIMLSVAVPNVSYKPFMLSAVRPNVIMLGVVAPFQQHYLSTLLLSYWMEWYKYDEKVKEKLFWSSMLIQLIGLY